MNKKQIALAVVLADFTAFTVYVLAQTGIVGFFELAHGNLASVQVLIDLVIALSLVMVWMWRDARQHDISPIPYVLLTLGLGSIGPLLYLVRRLGRETVAVPHPAMTSRVSAARA
ncbi:MAG: DUF2834 domain-containing protein [Candidatus Binatia bacterium]